MMTVNASRTRTNRYSRIFQTRTSILLGLVTDWTPTLRRVYRAATRRCRPIVLDWVERGTEATSFPTRAYALLTTTVGRTRSLCKTTPGVLGIRTKRKAVVRRATCEETRDSVRGAKGGITTSQSAIASAVPWVDTALVNGSFTRTADCENHLRAKCRGTLLAPACCWPIPRWCRA